MKLKLLICVAIPLLISVNPARAELSPETVAKMKKRATDVFQIKVIGVTVAESKSVKKPVLFKAKIVAIKKTVSKAKKGELIDIHSYVISVSKTTDPERLRKQLVELIGPKSPPLLKNGWKGTVYLRSGGKAKKGVKQYGIAVFGHSFEALPKSRKTERRSE